MAREGGQQHKSKGKSSQEEQQVEAAEVDAVAERKEKLDDDVDAILDDIDEVLESNAEEFVRGFVQKGGQ
ncbi:MAG: ubiquitin-like protein Pup [Nocardioidaceae bacterium]